MLTLLYYAATAKFNGNSPRSENIFTTHDLVTTRGLNQDPLKVHIDLDTQ